MTDGPEFPLVASFAWALGVGVTSYIATLLICDRYLRYSKRQWKKIDYVWLSFAGLGVVGSVSSARRTVAPGLIEWRTALVKSSVDEVGRQIRFLIGPAVCRRFVPGSLTESDLAELQRQYDSACRFGFSADSLFSDSLSSLEAQNLRTGKPRTTDPILQDVFREFDASIQQLEYDRRRLGDAQQALEPTSVEFAVTIFSPMLIAAALGLRFAKVSGELRLEA